MRRESDIPASPKDTCFVICPIGKEHSEVRRRSDNLFHDIIQPAAQENGLKALRADRIAEPGMITTQVIHHVLNDRVVVADLTDQNPNVFYEFALRHAFRKPVVQLLYAGQELPFNLLGIRTIEYSDSEGRTKTRKEVERQIATVLKPGYRVLSPVNPTVTLKDLGRKPQDINQLILATIQEQFDRLNNRRDQTDEILEQYAQEIDLLRDVKSAGITGICNNRDAAIKTFARSIDAETREIMVIGSSLKGLFQREEYRAVLKKLRFKAERGLAHVNFLLTHPIVAGLRAKAEGLHLTGIGWEIIDTLEALKEWNNQYRHVRLYLGTPTCFAIKTTNKMLINPYPYQSAAYHSPCLLLEYLSSEKGANPGFFFEQFNSKHFAAWYSDLSIPIQNFDSAIESLREMLPEYASVIESLVVRGKALEQINQGTEKSFNRKQNAVSNRYSKEKEEKGRLNRKSVKRVN